MLQETCFWNVDSPSPRSFMNKSLPESADVVVIGGGFTGLSAALRLAKARVQVVLLEGQTVGWGASSRNGGQALSCMPRNFTDLVKEHGEERTVEMFQTSIQAVDTVERIIREEKIDCDFARNGHIEAASKPAHFDVFKAEQDALKRFLSYEVQVLSKEEVSSELGTNLYHGLMVNSQSAGLQPARFVHGLAAAAERSGADIHEGIRVLRIEPEGPSGTNTHPFKILTDQGALTAKEVILAANAWIGEIIPQFRNRVFPAESFIIATKPLSDELAHRLILNRRVVYDTLILLSYYCLSRDNRMVWGGRDAATGASAKKNVERLRKGMVDAFPELESAQVEFYWSGTLGLTLDQNPHAGRVDGMWYSMCYVGHGVALATFMGEQLAKAILGEEYLNPFDGIKMPVVPSIRGKPWFVNLGKSWYRFLDAVS